MTLKIKISIPNPCHENWQAMSATEKGKFCASCQKNVYDFTAASDRQIIEAYNKDQNLCGRFLNTQLDRDLVKPKEKSSIWLATTSAVISFLALGNQEVTAQETVKTEQTDKKIFLGKPAPTQHIENPEKEITGIVSDSSGPLPGANVIVQGTQRGVQTEFNGTFKIFAKQGETLVFSFMGMKEESVIISQSTKYDVIMKDDVKGQIQYVTVGGIISKRRTFFGRQFQRIGNWFR